MIIVEGCDNTGKTTLINELCRNNIMLKLNPKGVRPAPREVLIDYLEDTLKGDRWSNLHQIFDRFPLISERVYGMALRGEYVLTEADFNKYDTMMYRMIPLVIYCDRPQHRILASFGDREQLDGVAEKITTIQRLYESTFDSLGLAWFVRYNYEEPNDYIRVARKLKNYLNSSGRRLW